jgi:hypothetical protein
MSITSRRVPCILVARSGVSSATKSPTALPSHASFHPRPSHSTFNMQLLLKINVPIPRFDTLPHSDISHQPIRPTSSPNQRQILIEQCIMIDMSKCHARNFIIPSSGLFFEKKKNAMIPTIAYRHSIRRTCRK